MSRKLRLLSVISLVLPCMIKVATVQGQPQPPPLPPVPVPTQNPITESKRVLGKILFWEEQISADNTVSCGTCHRPQFNATDPRISRNPGIDHVLNTADDILASPGVIHCDDNQFFSPDSVFSLQRQITSRAANPAVMAMYSTDLFWDGRARSAFTNPQTGTVSIPSGGALESQAVGPVVSSVEMGHTNRNWNEVTNKLTLVRPLILASNVPSDMASAITAHPTYPELFQQAFGDSTITAERIAFAIATYERTLLANQTPWDRFIAGETGALTPGQIQGWNTLRASPCVTCHTPPTFSNDTFQNIGLRPVAEDTGRQIVTGNPANRGQFKVPTLRGVGLKSTYMHTGVFSTLPQVIAFYANGGQQFPDNKSPLLPIGLPPPTVPAVVDFMANGLTDPRVASATFPFDRPSLFTEQTTPNPSLLGGTTAGTGGIAPRMIAVSPPNVMNIDFKIGVERALGGAQAYVAWSEQPPVSGQLVNATLFGPVTLNGTGTAGGYGTWKWPIDEQTIQTCDVYLQWRVTDPAAAGGIAQSEIAHLRMIPYSCGGDMNCDGEWNGLDVQAFNEALLNPSTFAVDYAGCSSAHGDLNGDNVIDINDIAPFVTTLMAE